MRCLKLILSDYLSQSSGRPCTLPGTESGDLEVLGGGTGLWHQDTDIKERTKIWVLVVGKPENHRKLQRRGKSKSHIQVQVLQNWNWSNRAQGGSIDNVVAHDTTHEWKSFLTLQPNNILPSFRLKWCFQLFQELLYVLFCCRGKPYSFVRWWGLPNIALVYSCCPWVVINITPSPNPVVWINYMVDKFNSCDINSILPCPFINFFICLHPIMAM